jgi:hypothetical protein
MLATLSGWRPRARYSSPTAEDLLLRLLKIEDYYQLSGGQRELSLLELMESLPPTEGIDFDAPRVQVELKLPEES